MGPGNISLDQWGCTGYHISCQIVSHKIKWVHQEAERINDAQASQSCCITLAFVLPIHYLFFSFSLSHFSFATHRPDEGMGRNAKAEMMCPRFPEALQLEHPIASLKEALEKVRGVVHQCTELKLRSYFFHANSSPRKFTGWPQ